MSKAKATFHSILWNHAGKIVEYILMYAASILIARGLGAAENGTFVGLFSLSQLLLVLCSLGLETSLNKFIPQFAHEHKDSKIAFTLRRILLLRVTACFAVAILFYSAIVLFAVPFLGQSRKILLLVLLFTGIRSIYPLYAMVLTAQLRTALTTRISVVIRTIELFAIIVLMQFSLTIENIIQLFLATSLLHVLAYVVFSRINVFAQAEPVDMKPMIQFGSIYWINTIVDFVLGRQGDILFLINLLPDPTQAGLYDVAYSLAQMTSMGATIGLAGVTFATFARLAVSNRETMDRFYGFSIRLISLLTIPLYAFLLFNTEDVLALLYSPKYLGAVNLVQGILVFRIVSRLFGGPENAEYLLSTGHAGKIVGFGVAAASINITLNILLVPILGAMGSVVAGGLGILAVNVMAAFGVYRHSSNRIQIGFWAKLTVVSVAASFVTMLVIVSTGILSLVVAGTIYATMLGIALYGIKPLAPSDTEWFSRIDHRLGLLLSPFTRMKMNLAQ